MGVDEVMAAVFCGITTTKSVSPRPALPRSLRSGRGGNDEYARKSTASPCRRASLQPRAACRSRGRGCKRLPIRRAPGVQARSGRLSRLEEGGWRDVYARCAPALYRLALRMLGREAEAWDAVQEVFRRVLERPGAFRREAQPMTYLYRAMTNHCLNVQRAERRRRLAEPGATEDAAPEAGISAALDAEQLKACRGARAARQAGWSARRSAWPTRPADRRPPPPPGHDPRRDRRRGGPLTQMGRSRALTRGGAGQAPCRGRRLGGRPA